MLINLLLSAIKLREYCLINGEERNIIFRKQAVSFTLKLDDL